MKIYAEFDPEVEDLKTINIAPTDTLVYTGKTNRDGQIAFWERLPSAAKENGGILFLPVGATLESVPIEGNALFVLKGVPPGEIGQVEKSWIRMNGTRQKQGVGVVDGLVMTESVNLEVFDEAKMAKLGWYRKDTRV